MSTSPESSPEMSPESSPDSLPKPAADSRQSGVACGVSKTASTTSAEKTAQTAGATGVPKPEVDPLRFAESELLAPAGLDLAGVATVAARLGGRGIDLGDLYFEHTKTESWSLEDSIVKSGSFAIDQGFGARAIADDRAGLAYADDFRPQTLKRAVDSAIAVTRVGGDGRTAVPAPRLVEPLYAPDDPTTGATAVEKVALLKRIDAYLRDKDPRVEQVMASLTGRFSTVLIAQPDGRMTADLRPLVRLNISVIVHDNGRRESAGHGGGGRYDYATLMAWDAVREMADEALRQALFALEAEAAPAGTMPVVLGPGWPGILLHEAIGHGLEGDFNRKGTSAFSGRIGERVASELCTIVDDGTLPGRRGSLSVDDEGQPTQSNMLIEKGILRGYMMDAHNARLMGQRSTGNGRRESYAHRPMPRMTNTYMLNGPHDPEEILKSVDRGIYAVSFGGGQVDITSGKFVFSASEAYLVEKGRVTRPIKGVTLIGNGPDVLTRVSMVGNNMRLDSGVGTCGKDGQSVPVGVGQPTVRIDQLTVGGTQT